MGLTEHRVGHSYFVLAAAVRAFGVAGLQFLFFGVFIFGHTHLTSHRSQQPPPCQLAIGFGYFGGQIHFSVSLRWLWLDSTLGVAVTRSGFRLLF